MSLKLNCEDTFRVDLAQEVEELQFDMGATLFVGQAGPILKGAFEVLLTGLPVTVNTLPKNVMLSCYARESFKSCEYPQT